MGWDLSLTNATAWQTRRSEVTVLLLSYLQDQLTHALPVESVLLCFPGKVQFLASKGQGKFCSHDLRASSPACHKW